MREFLPPPRLRQQSFCFAAPMRMPNPIFRRPRIFGGGFSGCSPPQRNKASVSICANECGGLSIPRPGRISSPHFFFIDLLRAEFPKTYAKRLRLRFAPLVKMHAENPYPRASVTTRLGRASDLSKYYGPFLSRVAAEKFHAPACRRPIRSKPRPERPHPHTPRPCSP